MKLTTFTVPDIKKRNDMEFSFDFNKRREARTIRIKIGDTEGEFDKEELWRALFIQADEDWSEKMLPVSAEAATSFTKLVEFIATEDIKKGGSCKIKVPFTVTNSVLEQLARERHIKI
jgi:hypothetical protein